MVRVAEAGEEKKVDSRADEGHTSRPNRVVYQPADQTACGHVVRARLRLSQLDGATKRRSDKWTPSMVC